ncbi:MAG: hypothetical protein Q8O72_16495, partial [Bacteroidales bacterium]|nr:hypothetical protein [Bacteroidales bacterium]
IKEMIQLDYNNEIELIKFVEKSGYFSKPLIVYKEAFENSRPNVIGLVLPANKYAAFSANRNVSKSENSDA